MYINRLHTHHLSPVGLCCCCKCKPNIHKLLYMGYCLCDNYTFVHIHFCICTLPGTALPQELVDSNFEQERSDLNRGCVVCATNMQVQWTRNWWKVFSFGCTIWVEEPAKLIYFCVDSWSIKHTYRWGDKSTISIPSIVVGDGTAVINSVTTTDQMKTYQDFVDCSLAIIYNIAENYDEVRLVFDRHMKASLKEQMRQREPRESQHITMWSTPL